MNSSFGIIYNLIPKNMSLKVLFAFFINSLQLFTEEVVPPFLLYYTLHISSHNLEYAAAIQPKKKRRRHHVATQPLSLRKFIMCFLCVLSRFGGYRVLTCTPCRRNRLSCKKVKALCRSNVATSFSEVLCNTIGGSLPVKGINLSRVNDKALNSSKLTDSYRKLDACPLFSNPLQYNLFVPPSHPALPRHYCFQLLLRGEQILKSNLNNNYHKQLWGRGG